MSEVLKNEPKNNHVVEFLFCGVASAGHDELALQLFADIKRPTDVSRMKQSVASGGCVRTAVAIDGEPTAWASDITYALRDGHQPFVEWVLADVEPGIGDDYVALAAKSGSLELVKWLFAKGYAVGGNTLRCAAASGNVDLCNWVVDHGLVPTQSDMEEAVREGHVNVLEWLSTMGCVCTSELLRLAVKSLTLPSW